MDKLKAYALANRAVSGGLKPRYTPPPVYVAPVNRGGGLKGGSPVNVNRGVAPTNNIKYAPVYVAPAPPPPPTITERVAAAFSARPDARAALASRMAPLAPPAPVVSLNNARRLKDSTQLATLPPVNLVPLGFQEATQQEPDDEPWTLYELPGGQDVAMPSSYIPPADWESRAELTDPNAIENARNSPIGWDNQTPEIQAQVQQPGDQPSLSQVWNPTTPRGGPEDEVGLDGGRYQQEAELGIQRDAFTADKLRRANDKLNNRNAVTIASDFAREQEQVANQQQTGEKLANYARFQRTVQGNKGTPIAIDPAQQVTEPALPAPQAARDWVIVRSERDGTIRAVPLADYEDPAFTDYYGPVQQIGGAVTEEQATNINANPDLTEPSPSTGTQAGDEGQVSARSVYPISVDVTWDDQAESFKDAVIDKGQDVVDYMANRGADALGYLKDIGQAYEDDNSGVLGGGILAALKEAATPDWGIPDWAENIDLPGTDMTFGDVLTGVRDGTIEGIPDLLGSAWDGLQGYWDTVIVGPQKEGNLWSIDYTYDQIMGSVDPDSFTDDWYRSAMGLIVDTTSGLLPTSTPQSWMLENRNTAVTIYNAGVDTDRDGIVDTFGAEAVSWYWQNNVASATDSLIYEVVSDPWNMTMMLGAAAGVVDDLLRESRYLSPIAKVVLQTVKGGTRAIEGAGSLGLEFVPDLLGVIVKKTPILKNILGNADSATREILLEGADAASEGLAALKRSSVDADEVVDVVRGTDGAITGVKMADDTELTLTPQQAKDITRQLSITDDSSDAVKVAAQTLKNAGVDGVDEIPPRFISPIQKIVDLNPSSLDEVNAAIQNTLPNMRFHVIAQNLAYGAGRSYPDAAVDTSRMVAEWRKAFGGMDLPDYVPSTPRQSDLFYDAETVIHSDWSSAANVTARQRLYRTAGTEYGMRKSVGSTDGSYAQAERYADLVAEHLRWNPDAMSDPSFARAYEEAQAIRQALADRGIRPRNSYSRRASRGTGTRTPGVDTTGPGAADNASGGGMPSRGRGTSTGESAPIATGGERGIPLPRGATVLDEVNGYPVVARRVVSGVTEEGIQVSENVRVVVRPVDEAFEARATNTATREMGDWLQAPTKPEALDLAIEDARTKGWMDEVTDEGSIPSPTTDTPAQSIDEPVSVSRTQSPAIPEGATVDWFERDGRLIDGFPAAVGKAFGKERTIVGLGRRKEGGTWEVVMHANDDGTFRARVQTKHKNARPWVEGNTEVEALRLAIADDAANIPPNLIWAQGTSPSAQSIARPNENNATVGDLVNTINGPRTPDPVDTPPSVPDLAVTRGVASVSDTLANTRRLYHWSDDDYTAAVSILDDTRFGTQSTPITPGELNTPGGRGLMNDVNNLIDKRKALAAQDDIANGIATSPKRRRQAQVTSEKLRRDIAALEQRIGLTDGASRKRIQATGKLVPEAGSKQAKTYARDVDKLTDVRHMDRGLWHRLRSNETGIVVDEGGIAYMATPFGDIPLTPEQLAELTKHTFENGDTTLDRWIKHINVNATNPRFGPEEIIEQARRKTLAELHDDLLRLYPKKEPSFFTKTWGRYTEYLRNQILGSWISLPRYWSNTTVGNMSNLVLGGYGADAAKVLNFKQVYRNGQDDLRRTLNVLDADHFTHNPEVLNMDRIANAFGTSRAPEIRRQIRTDTTVGTETPIEAWFTRNGVSRPFKGAARAVTGDSRGLRLALGMDMQMRDVVYTAAFNREVRQAFKEFRGAAKTRLVDTGLADAQAEDVIKRFMDAHPSGFSAEDVQRHFGDYLTDGLTDRLARDWRSAVSRIDKQARAEMRRVTFSGSATKLDEAIRPFIMFNFFMSRQYGFLIKQGLKHPGLVISYLEYQEFIDEYVKENPDMPTWAKGMIRVLQGPEGWSLLMNPMALWQIGSLFSNGVDMEDFNQTGFQEHFGWLVDNPYFFMHPGIQSALNVAGFLGDNRAFDPLNMQTWGRYAQLGENWLRYAGWLGDDQGIKGNRVADTGNQIRDYVSGLLDFLPGQDEIDYVESVGKEEAELRAIAWDLAIQQGMDPEHSNEDRQWLETAMQDPTSDFYKQAFKQYLQGESAGLTAKLIPLVASFQPITRYMDKDDKDLMESLKNLGNEEMKQFARTSDPDARAIDLASDRWWELQEDHPYGNDDVYQEIVYGTPQHSLDIDGVWYEPKEIMAMSVEERKDLVLVYFAQEGVLPYWQEQKDAEQQFLADPENRAYAQQKSWSTGVYGYTGGVEAYWQDVIKNNPNARRYYEGLDPDLSEREREQALTSRWAFMSVAGIQGNVYEAQPLDTNYYDPLDIANKAPQAIPFEPYVSDYEKETRKQVDKYEAEMTRADPVIQRIMSDWGIPEGTTFNQVYYKTRFDIMDEYERRTGDKLPYEDGDNFWAAQQYWRWADVQPVGSDTSLDAYFDAQDQEWESQMPANFNSSYTDARDETESYEWYDDYRSKDPGHRWEDED